jgi:hypothetical protein
VEAAAAATVDAFPRAGWGPRPAARTVPVRAAEPGEL